MSNDHDYESRVESDLEEAREDTMEQGILNYRFLTTETNSKALYIFRHFYPDLISKALWSDCADFLSQTNKQNKTKNTLMYYSKKFPMDELSWLNFGLFISI